MTQLLGLQSRENMQRRQATPVKPFKRYVAKENTVGFVPLRTRSSMQVQHMVSKVTTMQTAIWSSTKQWSKGRK